MRLVIVRAVQCVNAKKKKLKAECDTILQAYKLSYFEKKNLNSYLLVLSFLCV